MKFYEDSNDWIFSLIISSQRPFYTLQGVFDLYISSVIGLTNWFPYDYGPTLFTTFSRRNWVIVDRRWKSLSRTVNYIWLFPTVFLWSLNKYEVPHRLSIAEPHLLSKWYSSYLQGRKLMRFVSSTSREITATSGVHILDRSLIQLVC